ncbi:MAG: thioredoxin family protein [Planctomycetota bacterium]
MWRLWTLGLVLAIISAAPLAAEELKVGDQSPEWAGIIGTDDKQHSLADYSDAKLLVIVFTCNHCPVAKAYEDRLVQLQSDYKDKGVRVIAVNVNNMPADRLDQMKVRAEEKGFNFPYLYDETQKIAKDFGAKVTPHVFLLDQDRKVAYVGSIDDSQNQSKVEKQHLRNALDSLLQGQTPEVQTVKAFGCSIKYES